VNKDAGKNAAYSDNYEVIRPREEFLGLHLASSLSVFTSRLAMLDHDDQLVEHGKRKLHGPEVLVFAVVRPRLRMVIDFHHLITKHKPSNVLARVIVGSVLTELS
jgi:hypothetical protein